MPTHSSSLRLSDVHVCPSLIKNLLSVRKLTPDNNLSVEFDPFGFSIKDLCSRALLLRSDSGSDLYPLSCPAPPPRALHASVDLWHARLGHPGRPTLSRI